MEGQKFNDSWQSSQLATPNLGFHTTPSLLYTIISKLKQQDEKLKND